MRIPGAGENVTTVLHRVRWFRPRVGTATHSVPPGFESRPEHHYCRLGRYRLAISEVNEVRDRAPLSVRAGTPPIETPIESHQAPCRPSTEPPSPEREGALGRGAPIAKITATLRFYNIYKRAKNLGFSSNAARPDAVEPRPDDEHVRAPKSPARPQRRLSIVRCASVSRAPWDSLLRRGEAAPRRRGESSTGPTIARDAWARRDALHRSPIARADNVHPARRWAKGLSLSISQARLASYPPVRITCRD